MIHKLRLINNKDGFLRCTKVAIVLIKNWMRKRRNSRMRNVLIIKDFQSKENQLLRNYCSSTFMYCSSAEAMFLKPLWNLYPRSLPKSGNAIISTLNSWKLGSNFRLLICRQQLSSMKIEMNGKFPYQRRFSGWHLRYFHVSSSRSTLSTTTITFVKPFW